MFQLALATQRDFDAEDSGEGSAGDKCCVFHSCFCSLGLPMSVSAVPVVERDPDAEDSGGEDSGEEEGGGDPVSVDPNKERQRQLQQELMGDPDRQIGLVIDRWLRFRVRALDAAILFCLRARLAAAFSWKVLHCNCTDPVLVNCVQYSTVLSVMGAEILFSILSSDGLVSLIVETHCHPVVSLSSLRAGEAPLRAPPAAVYNEPLRHRMHSLLRRILPAPPHAPPWVHARGPHAPQHGHEPAAAHAARGCGQRKGFRSKGRRGPSQGRRGQGEGSCRERRIPCWRQKRARPALGAIQYCCYTVATHTVAILYRGGVHLGGVNT